MAHTFVRDVVPSRCECGAPGCALVHEPRQQHWLAGVTQDLLSQLLLVTCVCGESAQYDPVWGQMLVPSMLWKRAANQVADYLDEHDELRRVAPPAQGT